MSSNKQKHETLGMPHGTATGRLRKLILFDLLQRHKENICVRCRKIIETPYELSIEHLHPWEGISAELFWDLNNIAFAHMACNRPHRNPGPKIITPDGTAWCSRHQAALPVAEFHKCSSKDDGMQPYCKVCQAARDTRANHAKKV